jgi:hypothetical protein
MRPGGRQARAEVAQGDDDSPTIGWREWVRLPELGGATVKAKVDTGARTSTLHAFDVAESERDGEARVSFAFHPNQNDEETEIRTDARLVDRRTVTASNGQSELRYVVETEVDVDGESIPIELTLTRRDAMGFRMLLGRHALRGRFKVDPELSYRGKVSRRLRRKARKERKSK